MTDTQGAASVPRTEPPHQADELATLAGFLDFLREAIVIKTTGVDDDALRRPMTPSGVCLLGIVKHLATVERWWFARVYAGLDVGAIWTDDPDADWRIEPDDKTEVILDLYRSECDRGRALVEASRPGDLSKGTAWGGKHFSLRWIVTHMIEETGRHAGHADILRELIDGQTGE